MDTETVGVATLSLSLCHSHTLKYTFRHPGSLLPRDNRSTVLGIKHWQRQVVQLKKSMFTRHDGIEEVWMYVLEVMSDVRAC